MNQLATTTQNEPMRIYGYLRASTDEQDATRAKEQLLDFTVENKLDVCAWFVENESGATLKRPELFMLIEIAQEGDILLVEQVDRISRLNATNWQNLKNTITTKGINIVALDLPTSHQFLTLQSDEFTSRMFSAINAMMLDMLAAVARKDYDDRRRRQKQGIEKAKGEGRYKGCSIDVDLHRKIADLLEAGKTYSYIQDMLNCSRATIAKVKKGALKVGR